MAMHGMVILARPLELTLDHKLSMYPSLSVVLIGMTKHACGDLPLLSQTLGLT